MSRRRWATVTQAVEPPRAILALFDWVARAIGALALMAALATQVLPFAKTHGRGTDLLACVVLVLVAVPVLKAFGPKLSYEIRGVAYTALLLAGGLAFYLVTVSPSGPTARGHHDEHRSATAGAPASRSRRASRNSYAKTRQASSSHAQRIDATSSSSSARRSASSRSTPTSTAGSSSVAGTSVGQSGSAPQRSYSPQPARQTTATRHSTRSTKVEIESSKAPSAPPAKTSPAVEVQSDKAQSSGIEIGN